jgi:hypothetical protein
VTAPVTIRCSSLPRLAACPPSIQAPQVLIDRSTGDATLGRAVHAAIADILRGGLIEDSDIEGVIGKHATAAAVEPIEILPLVQFAIEWCHEYLGEFGGDLLIEQQLRAPTMHSHLTVSGTPDVRGYPSETVVRVADWKSGYKSDEGAHREQLIGYAWLAMTRLPRVKRVTADVIWLRDHSFDHYAWTPAVLQAEFVALVDRIIATEAYRPGEACRYCPRFFGCPARIAEMRGLLAIARDGETELDDSEIVRLYPLMAQAEKSIGLLRHRLSDEILSRGDLVGGDGARLQLNEQERQTIDARQAWPILTEHLGDDELAECLTVGKTALLAKIAAKAPPRKGAKAKRELMATLDEAGAVTRKTYHRLNYVAAPKPEPQKTE